jgi:hypothetical protein
LVRELRKETSTLKLQAQHYQNALHRVYDMEDCPPSVRLVIDEVLAEAEQLGDGNDEVDTTARTKKLKGKTGKGRVQRRDVNGRDMEFRNHGNGDSPVEDEDSPPREGRRAGNGRRGTARSGEPGGHRRNRERGREDMSR